MFVGTVVGIKECLFYLNPFAAFIAPRFNPGRYADLNAAPFLAML